MIIIPEDIEREKDASGHEQTTNLPFELQAFFNNEGSSFSLYGKNDELIKMKNIPKRDANCIIFGVIEAYSNIKSVFFGEGIID